MNLARKFAKRRKIDRVWHYDGGMTLVTTDGEAILEMGLAKSDVRRMDVNWSKGQTILTFADGSSLYVIPETLQRLGILADLFGGWFEEIEEELSEAVLDELEEMAKADGQRQVSTEQKLAAIKAMAMSALVRNIDGGRLLYLGQDLFEWASMNEILNRLTWAGILIAEEGCHLTEEEMEILKNKEVA